ncbi:MAG: hypothetical protein ABIC04_07155 [Nanoarchaeota archaeon]
MNLDTGSEEIGNLVTQLSDAGLKGIPRDVFQASHDDYKTRFEMFLPVSHIEILTHPLTKEQIFQKIADSFADEFGIDDAYDSFLQEDTDIQSITPRKQANATEGIYVINSRTDFSYRASFYLHVLQQGISFPTGETASFALASVSGSDRNANEQYLEGLMNGLTLLKDKDVQKQLLEAANPIQAQQILTDAYANLKNSYEIKFEFQKQ